MMLPVWYVSWQYGMCAVIQTTYPTFYDSYFIKIPYPPYPSQPAIEPICFTSINNTKV